MTCQLYVEDPVTFDPSDEGYQSCLNCDKMKMSHTREVDEKSERMKVELFAMFFKMGKL